MNVDEIADAFERVSHGGAAPARERRPSIETAMDRLTQDLRLAGVARAGAEYLRHQPVRRQPVARARTPWR